jgi:predicted nucleic-acid-binding Zn-ribbon protein
MKCPKCGNKDFDKFGKSEEQFVEAIPIYEME